MPACTTANECFTKLNQYGESTPLPAAATEFGEFSIDTQSVHTFAPGAKIKLFEANSGNSSDLYSTINMIVSNHMANIISNSWSSTGEFPDSPLEIILQQAAAEGISVNFSSGDSADNAATLGKPAVNYPGSSSWVTAVGGTSLLLTSDLRYKSETGWAWPFQVPNPNPLLPALSVGSTGGLSQYYTAGLWQSDAIGSISAGGYGLVGTHRAVPDISMLGDPQTGMAYISNGAWGNIGGTSVACPEFSGLIALVNQSRVTNSKTSVGLVAPLLYTMKYNPHQSIAPITSVIPPHATSVSVLTGGPHWNDITGLGSPYAPLFIQALANEQ